MEVRSQDKRDFHAFVLMPFDPEFEDIYSDLIARTLESEGFTVDRADSSLDQQNVLKDIIHGIARAHLVVAELTGMNPNVLYELGIAHALGKPTVVLTQAVEDVPFDLRSYRMIVYSVHYAEAKALRDRLGDIASRLKERSIRFGNPVTDFASGLIRMPEPVEPLAAPALYPEEDASEQEPLGVLDFQVEAMMSLERIGEYMQSMGKMAESLTQKMVKRTAEMESLGKAPPSDVRRLRQVPKAIARDMTDYATELEGQLPGFHEAWERMAENTMNVFSTLNIESPEDRQSMEDLIVTVDKFQDALREALSSTLQMRQTFPQMRGFTKDVNVAVQRTERAVDGLIEELAIGESYVARILNLLKDRLETPLDDSHDKEDETPDNA